MRPSPWTIWTHRTQQSVPKWYRQRLALTCRFAVESEALWMAASDDLVEDVYLAPAQGLGTGSKPNVADIVASS